MFWSSTPRSSTQTASRLHAYLVHRPAFPPENQRTSSPVSRARHTSPIITPPYVFPSSSPRRLLSMFTPSAARKKQPEPSQTTLRHKAACFFSGLPRSLPSSARLAYGLAGWRTTGTQCHTRAHIFTTPSSARVVHPSIIIPLAGQRWGDVSGTLPVVLIGLDRLHQVMGRLQASSAEPNRKSYQ